MTSQATIVESLRQEGYRLTPQRLMILSIINDSVSHISAEEIHQKVCERYPFVNISTIYRTLNLLKKLRVISETDLGEGYVRYELLERVRLALEQVGMVGFEERLPHHLSLGQKKRIAIATVLSMSPAILALDEPFSSLDPSARRELMDLLQALPQTMIVSTHHIAIIRHLFPRTVVMDDGCIVADGDTEAILADAALLEAHGLEVF